MMRLIYRDAALDDIDGIMEYIEPHNPAAALELGRGIIDTCRLFKTHPEIGMRCDQVREGLRMFTHRGYRIFYTIDTVNRVVNVARVIHPKMNLNSDMFET